MLLTWNTLRFLKLDYFQCQIILYLFYFLGTWKVGTIEKWASQKETTQLRGFGSKTETNFD